MMHLFIVLVFSSIALFTAEIHEKVLICGVCRDVEARLAKTQAIMESIGELFDDYRILVYENNSMDRTAEILHVWAQKNPRIWLKSENLSNEHLEEIVVNINRDGSFFVPEQIARARNLVLQEVWKSAYQDFPYVIWMDMDFVQPPNLEGFIDTFASNREWDAVLAYGVDPDNIFWDWYALRDPIYPLGPELLGTEWYTMTKQIELTQQSDWYPVYSAFGGCGIYKKTSIEGCSYSALVTPDLAIHTKRLIAAGRDTHPQIMKFLNFSNQLKETQKIEEAVPHLPMLYDVNMGILLHNDPDSLPWRMNTFVYQYPSVCEHVPFHASMICRGHDKLYINPKLVFRYGN